MTENELVELIRRKVAEAGGRRLAAKAWGVSLTYLSGVVRGEIRPGASITDAIGYERGIVYRPKGRRAKV